MSRIILHKFTMKRWTFTVPYAPYTYKRMVRTHTEGVVLISIEDIGQCMHRNWLVSCISGQSGRGGSFVVETEVGLRCEESDSFFGGVSTMRNTFRFRRKI